MFGVESYRKFERTSEESTELPCSNGNDHFRLTYRQRQLEIESRGRELPVPVYLKAKLSTHMKILSCDIEDRIQYGFSTLGYP
ncbi:hypothetical protein P5V15_001025 [Pogonomyrmex californicus]